MSVGRHVTTPMLVMLTLTLTSSAAWSSRSSTSKSASFSSSASDRSVVELLASVEQKLGFVLHSQGGIHQLHYAMTQVSRRLDNVEVRMARLEHRLDTKLDGLKSVAHGIAAKMAMLEAQGGVLAQNLASKLERTETNVLAALDERTANVAKIVDDLGKFVRVNVTDRIGATTQIVANVSLVTADASSSSSSTTTTKNFTADGTFRVRDHTAASASAASGEPSEAPWWPSSSVPFNSTEPMVVVLDRRLQDLNSDLEIYTRKVMNTYQEMMKESKTIDVSLRKLLEQGNQTRLTVREAFRKLYQHTKPVSSLDDILNSLTKKVAELAATVDSSFASLLVAQNTFIATCHRVQQQEPVVETRIYHLLHKLVHDIGNKSKTYKEDCGLREAFDSHREDVGRALHDLVWTVITVGNQTVEDLRKANECNCEQETTTTTSPRPPDLAAPSTEAIIVEPSINRSKAMMDQTDRRMPDANDLELTTPISESSVKSPIEQQPAPNVEIGAETDILPTVMKTKLTGSDVLPESLPEDDDDIYEFDDQDGGSRTTDEGQIDESIGSNGTEYQEMNDQEMSSHIQT